MNPYAKIAIKIGVVLIVCIVLMVAFNVLAGKPYQAAIEKIRGEIKTQRDIEAQLVSLLNYSDLLPNIVWVQTKDMETIRNIVPPADEFSLTGYLRVIHKMLTDNHLETGGIGIQKPTSAVGGVDFETAFSSDISALQKDLDKIKASFDYFRDNKGEMNNFFKSFQFYRMISTDAENYEAIIGGIETHTFSLSVRGSYQDIKKFTFDVFNMRPRTALINFQMAPTGPGYGATRTYNAGFVLLTYGDVNLPPPLLRDASDEVEEETQAEGETGEGETENGEGDESKGSA